MNVNGGLLGIQSKLKMNNSMQNSQDYFPINEIIFHFLEILMIHIFDVSTLHINIT